MHIDLVDLRLFRHVAEAASITHGAARANMALATASERIAGMEHAAGVQLLLRQRRGVVLTQAGRALAHHARLVLQGIDEMAAELSGFAGGLKGQVRMLANSTALSEFLPEKLESFLADNPGVDIDAEERASYDIVRAVADGYVEIGVVADIVDFAGLYAFPFATDRLVLVTPQRHPLAGGRLAFRDMLGEDFVGMAAGNALQQHIGQHALQAGRALKLRVRLGSFDAVCRMVGSGVGIAIVPETAARRCRRTMAIRMTRLTDPWSLRHLHVCVRNPAQLALPAHRLLEHLTAHERSKAAAR